MTDKATAFRNLADEARERLAGEVFDVDRILTDAARAAALGYGCIEVKPKVPVDLTKTATAIATMHRLEGLGFEVSREVRSAGPKSNPTGHRQDFIIVVVSW